MNAECSLVRGFGWFAGLAGDAARLRAAHCASRSRPGPPADCFCRCIPSDGVHNRNFVFWGRRRQLVRNAGSTRTRQQHSTTQRSTSSSHTSEGRVAHRPPALGITLEKTARHVSGGARHVAGRRVCVSRRRHVARSLTCFHPSLLREVGSFHLGTARAALAAGHETWCGGDAAMLPQPVEIDCRAIARGDLQQQGSPRFHSRASGH